MKLLSTGVLIFAYVLLWHIQSAKGQASCSEAFNGTEGIYTIRVGNRDPVKVYCIPDRNANERAWTVVVRRNKGSENFDRNLNDYVNGFGDLDKDHFIGLDLLHAMTSSRPHELLINAANDQESRYSRYDLFAIGDSSQNYILLTLGLQLESPEFDSFRTQMGMRFSTKDKDFTAKGCPSTLNAGWWFYEKSWYINHDCADCYLTSTYNNSELPEYTYHDMGADEIPIITVAMAVRPYQV